MDYTKELVIAILENRELIEAFLERTTSELFPVYYDLGNFDEFFSREGNTLLDAQPNTTRIPKKDSLKENLLVLKADVDRAIEALDPWDQISIQYYFGIFQGKRATKSSSYALEALNKVVTYLNYGTTDTSTLSCQP